MQSVEDPTAFRANIQGRLNQVLDTNTNANTNTLATDLEKGVFNYAIKEAGIQKS